MESTKLNKLLALVLVTATLIVVTNISSYAQEHKGHDHSVKKEAKTQSDSSIVHKGIINLKKIDKNKDGKVYQDQMDWNVISDAPGKCPLCKMVLEEVTLKKA